MAGTASPALANAPSVTTEREPVEGIDYIYSVIDEEDPTEVEARAKKALGNRFVELWVTEDQLSYSIGVLNLTPAETPALKKEITGKVPVKLVDRDVSRTEVDALLKQVKSEAKASNTDGEGAITSFTPDYSSGSVYVGFDHGKEREATSLVEKRTKKKTRKSTMRAEARRSLSGGKYSSPTIVVHEDGYREAESQTANPYRSGKRITVAGSSCTAGFAVRKNGVYYGMTAGHCGRNGSHVYFAGKRRGNIQNNVYYATATAHSDVALFNLPTNASATMYMSASKNYKVTGSYATKYLRKGSRVCARGSVSNAQTCGPTFNENVTRKDSRKWVKNLHSFDWKSGPGTKGGDSGGPVYRVISSNAVWAAGITLGANDFEYTYFNPIRVVLSDTGSTLFTTK